MIDTGSDISIITNAHIDFLKRKGLHDAPITQTPELYKCHSVTGHSLNVLGVTQVYIDNNNRRSELTVAVVDNLHAHYQMILGLDFMIPKGRIQFNFHTGEVILGDQVF